MFRIYLIALCSILSAPSLAANVPIAGQTMFAIFFNYASNHDLPYCPRIGLTRCVFGSLKPEQSILLLSSKSSNTCLAHAIRTFPSNWDSGSVPLTRIGLDSCPDFTFDLAAITSDQPDYKRLDGSASPSASKADEIDIQIRLKAKGFKPSSDVHTYVLAATKPELFRLPNMDSDSYIAVYQNADEPGDQVHFLYSNGRVKLIHSAATIQSIFSLGGKSYIHYKFSCNVGCGYYGDIVIQLTNNDFEIVLFDASAST